MWRSSDRTVNKEHNLGVAELEHVENDMGRDPTEVKYTTLVFEVYQFLGKFSRCLSLDCTYQCAECCLVHQWLVVLDMNFPFLSVSGSLCKICIYLESSHWKLPPVFHK